MGKEQEGRYYESEIACDERGRLYLCSKIFLKCFPKTRLPDSFILDFPMVCQPFLPFPEGLDQETEDDLRYWRVEIADELPQEIRSELSFFFYQLEEAIGYVSFENEFVIFRRPLLTDLNSSSQGKPNTKDWQHPLTSSVLLELFSLPFFEEGKREFWKSDKFLVNFDQKDQEEKVDFFLFPTTLSEKGVFFLLGSNDRLYLSVFSPEYTQKLRELFKTEDKVGVIL